MDASDIIMNIVNTSNKISSYQALLATTEAMYEQLQFKIYQMSVEISSGQFDINNGSQVYEGVSNAYIKKSILGGLKKKALSIIEDQVILEFMISERQEQLTLMKQQLVAVENSQQNQ